MTPIYRYDIQQNTPEWDTIKLGRFSASVADDLLMPPKNKGYQELISKIFEERYTGEPCESKKWKGNSFTERGHEYEPIAVEDFVAKNFYSVQEVGFVELGDWIGCSPDRLIGKDGLLQAKCPIFNTQYTYLEIMNTGGTPAELLNKMDSGYYKQMQFELFVCNDREYNIFYSYHPKLPEIQLRIERDEAMIKEFKSKIEIAKIEILQRIEKLK